MPPNPFILPQKEDPIQQAVDQLTADIARRAYRLRQQHARKLNSNFRQGDLAKACGLRQQAISKLERGEYRRSQFLITCWKVANFFGENPAIFIFGHSTSSSAPDKPALSEPAMDIARRWDAANDTVKDIVAKLLGPLV